jgi:hypothetical protein
VTALALTNIVSAFVANSIELPRAYRIKKNASFSVMLEKNHRNSLLDGHIRQAPLFIFLCIIDVLDRSRGRFAKPLDKDPKPNTGLKSSSGS